MVCKEAQQIIDKFTGEHAARKFNIKEPQRAKKIYEKLEVLATKIRIGREPSNEALQELKHLILEQEITSFQFNQSGIAGALITYLTDSSTHFHPQRKLKNEINFNNLKI